MPAKIMFSGLVCLLVFLVAVLFVLAAHPVFAQTRSPALQKVIDGAKKEGILKIQWLSGRLDGEAGLRPMIAAMNKTYGTNVQLQYTPGPAFAQMLNKIIQEKAAGVSSSTDVNLMTSNHVAEGLKHGVLKKLDWNSLLERQAPADANVNRVAPEGAAVMIASRVAGVTYNSNLVSCFRNSMNKSRPHVCHSRESGNPEVLKFPGFRLALAIASLAGMTLEIFNEL